MWRDENHMVEEQQSHGHSIYALLNNMWQEGFIQIRTYHKKLTEYNGLTFKMRNG